MLKFSIPLLVLSLAACSHHDLVSTDTAGIVGIEIDGEVKGFLFISKHGKALPIYADECAQSSECQDMVKEFQDADKAMLMQFHAENKDDPPTHYLPHRTSGLDPQGHLPERATHTEDCPMPLFVYDGAGSPLFLLCFSHD